MAYTIENFKFEEAKASFYVQSLARPQSEVAHSKDFFPHLFAASCKRFIT